LRDTLAKLVTLQSIDDEARGFLQERNELQAKIERLKELLGLMQQGLAEKQVKLDEATKWYQEKAGELKIDEEKVVKAKAKLQTVTKNKEYMAMQKEIENLRKGIVNRQEEILKLLEAIEEFKGSIKAEKKKIRALGKEVASEEAANAERITELEAEIATISSRKDEVTKDLKPALVSRYRRIHKARDGIVIVPARNRACSACNFAVPAQQLVRIELSNTMEVCRNCSRMLYWPAPEPEAETEDGGEAATPA